METLADINEVLRGSTNAISQGDLSQAGFPVFVANRSALTPARGTTCFGRACRSTLAADSISMGAGIDGAIIVRATWAEKLALQSIELPQVPRSLLISFRSLERRVAVHCIVC